VTRQLEIDRSSMRTLSRSLQSIFSKTTRQSKIDGTLVSLGRRLYARS
jgi:hypothetical protein